MDVKKILITAGKMAGHGLPFALLGFTAALIWARLFSTFLGLNAWLSLIGFLAVLAVGWGLLNLLMTYVLWFLVDYSWRSFIPQGFALLIIFFTIEILPLHFVITPLAALGYSAYLTGFIVLNVFFSFADGWIAMKMGAHWKARGIPRAKEDAVAFTPEPPILPNNPKGLHCPRCGGVNLVVAQDVSAYCVDCGRGIRKERLGGTVG
jgi:hypothetical protein